MIAKNRKVLVDMRYLLKGASLCNRASPGRRASCARSGESTYVSGHDESNKELDIMFDSSGFIVRWAICTGKYR